MTNILVSTTLGNTILAPDTLVPVRVNNRVYISKKVSDLVPDRDVVIYERQYVQRTLEEIEPYLTSPRYMRAVNTLFEINSQGMRIPRLRSNLWRGIYPNADQSSVLHDGTDFSQNDYRDATDHVHSAINGAVTKSAVRKWLTGETVAPDNKDLYGNLASLFGQIQQPDKPALMFRWT